MVLSNELLSIIVKIIISGGFSLITVYAVPWLKQKGLYNKVKLCVYAAEKLKSSGALTTETKKEYVIRVLTSMGVTCDETVEVMIEAAVQELDNQSTKLAESMKDE